MAHGIAETLDQFFEKVGVPESIVSVGCGPAISSLDLAGVHPDSHFSGYDISQTVFNEARTRRDERGSRNVSFAVDRLPKLQTDRTFDLVYCFATLHYVADSETAIRSLLERVALLQDLDLGRSSASMSNSASAYTSRSGSVRSSSGVSGRLPGQVAGWWSNPPSRRSRPDPHRSRSVDSDSTAGYGSASGGSLSRSKPSGSSVIRRYSVSNWSR